MEGMRCLKNAIFQLTTSRRGRPKELDKSNKEVIFQLTTSRRGRHRRILVRIKRKYFQLTTSRRGRHPAPEILPYIEPFNSRPHAEVDVLFFCSFIDIFELSTHDLTQRSTFCAVRVCEPIIFQLTTSRRGRQD